MAVDVASLLHLIQQHPFLYDKADESFRDNVKKENTWKEIAETLGCGVEQVKTRWRTLRERYGKEMRLHDLRRRSGVKQERTSIWEWYVPMHFLQEHIKHRKSFGSHEMAIESSSSCATSPLHLDLSNEDISDIDLVSESSSRMPVKRRKRCDTATYIDAKLLKTIKALETVDEDELFGKLVATELRKVQDDEEKKRRKAKMYIIASGLERV